MLLPQVRSNKSHHPYTRHQGRVLEKKEAKHRGVRRKKQEMLCILPLILSVGRFFKKAIGLKQKNCIIIVQYNTE